MGDVAGDRADVGSLRDGGGQGRAVGARFDELELEYRHLPRFKLDRFAGPGAGVGRLSLDLQRRIGWRHLLDFAGEPWKDGFDMVGRRSNLAGRDGLAFRIE